MSRRKKKDGVWRWKDLTGKVAYIPHFGFSGQEMEMVSEMFGEADTVTRERLLEQRRRLTQPAQYSLLAADTRAIDIIDRLLAAWEGEG